MNRPANKHEINVVFFVGADFFMRRLALMSCLYVMATKNYDFKFPAELQYIYWNRLFVLFSMRINLF